MPISEKVGIVAKIVRFCCYILHLAKKQQHHFKGILKIRAQWEHCVVQQLVAQLSYNKIAQQLRDCSTSIGNQALAVCILYLKNTIHTLVSALHHVPLPNIEQFSPGIMYTIDNQKNLMNRPMKEIIYYYAPSKII